MPMTQEPLNASAAGLPQCIVTSRQRDPPSFTGLRGDDVEDWLDGYARASAYNNWDDTLKLRNVSYHLTEVARTWFFNNESTIEDWAAFTTRLRKVFGSSAARSEGAKKKLEGRMQHPDETYTSYIEDVLALCRRVNKDMSEADRVRHILKGIGQFAFTALALQNPTTVSDVTATCLRLDELQSMRLQPEPQALHLGDEGLRTLIRTIIREELHTHSASCAPTPVQTHYTPGLREIVKEELASMTDQAASDHAAPLPAPSYAEVARRPPTSLAPITSWPQPGYVAAYPPAPQPRPYYPTWPLPRSEPPANRPVCYYCGIRGHIARFCRRRQQDERRGYAADERDEMGNRHSYRQRFYPSPTRRTQAPLDSSDVPRNSREQRRRSPSPFRRTSSPLRPVIHDTNRLSEN